jgi:hypothetical protein
MSSLVSSRWIPEEVMSSLVSWAFRLRVAVAVGCGERMEPTVKGGPTNLKPRAQYRVEGLAETKIKKT